jgi:hypothetical protein
MRAFIFSGARRYIYDHARSPNSSLLSTLSHHGHPRYNLLYCQSAHHILAPLLSQANFVQICPYAQRVGPVSLLLRVEVLIKVATTGGNRLPRGESGRDQVLD